MPLGGHLSMSGDISVVPTKECYWHLVDIGWDAAKRAAMQRTVPTTKNSPAPHVNSAKVENPSSR